VPGQFRRQILDLKDVLLSEGGRTNVALREQGARERP
jgi:hypothetical protein